MNTRIVYNAGSSPRNCLPDPSSGYQPRECLSASTSPSGRRYITAHNRRNSKPDQYLLMEPTTAYASRSQEDVRSTGSYNAQVTHRRPSARYERRDYLGPSQLADDDDDRNTSTDDEMDLREQRSRSPRLRAPSDSRLSSGGHYYYGSSPTSTDDRSRPSNSRSRNNLSDIDRKERHRRASLHLETLRQRDDLDLHSYNQNNLQVPTRQSHSSSTPTGLHHNEAPTASSPKLQRRDSATAIQLLFGGNTVKDYNQYSSQPPPPSVQSANNSNRRSSPGIDSEQQRVLSQQSRHPPISNAIHRLNCHAPSGSYY